MSASNALPDARLIWGETSFTPLKPLKIKLKQYNPNKPTTNWTIALCLENSMQSSRKFLTQDAINKIKIRALQVDCSKRHRQSLAERARTLAKIILPLQAHIADRSVLNVRIYQGRRRPPHNLLPLIKASTKE